jgi:TolB protein
VFDETGVPVYTDLRNQGSDAIAAGSVTKLVDGRFDVRYKLWDVVKGRTWAARAWPWWPATCGWRPTASPTRSTRS